MKRVLRLMGLIVLGAVLVFFVGERLRQENPIDEFGVAADLMQTLSEGGNRVRYFGSPYDEEEVYRALEAQWPYAFSMKCRKNSVGWVEFEIITENEAAQKQAAVYAQGIVRDVLPPGTSQNEALKLMHDWVVTHCTYDSDAAAQADADEGSTAPFTAAGALVGGKAVCAGYARAFMQLCQAAGIDCLYITSDEMNHGWNLVRTEEGVRYIDCTYDDPLPDRGEYAMHDYFLLEESELARSHQWDKAFYRQLMDSLWNEK